MIKIMATGRGIFFICLNAAASIKQNVDTFQLYLNQLYSLSMFRPLLTLSFLFLLCKFSSAEDLRGDTIDIRSYKINIDLSDFTTKVLHADVTISLKARMNNVERSP